jgi:shikimate dehydrogenase
VVLGAGGSARAVVWALREAGAADVAIWNRTAARARALAAELGGRAVETVERADIVVNCTSVGLRAGDATFKALPVTADSLGAGSLVVDLVYRDGGTQLLDAARARGASVVDGLEILVAQGAASFERWTGTTAPRQAMRAAVRDIASL